MKKRKFWIEDLQDILRSLVNIQKQNVVKEVV